MGAANEDQFERLQKGKPLNHEFGDNADSMRKYLHDLADQQVDEYYNAAPTLDELSAEEEELKSDFKNRDLGYENPRHDLEMK